MNKIFNRYLFRLYHVKQNRLFNSPKFCYSTKTEDIREFKTESEDSVVETPKGQRKWSIEFPGTRSDFATSSQIRDFRANEVEEEDDVVEIPEGISRNVWTLRKEIKKILNEEKNLPKALDTFTDAIKREGFVYNKSDFKHLYNIMISACAQYGHCNVAFKLFKEMRSRQIEPKESTYTSLFNVCANSPWNEINLKRMEKLRFTMKQRGVPMNLIHYHALMKALGRFGKTEKAFACVDEMVNQEIQPTDETFSFLLQACISNKENGFFLAIKTWSKMRELNIRAKVYNYNLLLRTIRECSYKFDDVKPTQQFQLKFNNYEDPTPKFIHEIDNTSNSISTSLTLITKSEIDLHERKVLVNFLARRENRFMTIGGIMGVLNETRKDKVKVNLITLTEFLQLIPPEQIDDLITLMEKFKIKPDIHFCNLMIKRFSANSDYLKAKDVLQFMAKQHLSPNIMTYGVLAFSSKTWASAQAFLKDMDDANFVPNIQIFGMLLLQAAYSFNNFYVLRLMEEAKRREIIIDEKFLFELDKYRTLVRNGILNKEKGRRIDPPRLEKAMENKEFFEDWQKFIMRYDSWRKELTLKEESKDPWESDYRKRYPKRNQQESADP